MCGIFGLFCDQGHLTQAPLEKATAVMEHRGPDARRIWLADDRCVGLGHTRLSIIDLTGGEQPLTNEDGTIHAVVNGEIYDFERIRLELQTQGHRFQTASDSEVVIHLYETSGLDLLEQLRGEYAFILWDATRRRLIAARDRFGVKPLYYAFHQGKLFLASEIKALLAAGVPAGWDEESLYNAAHFGFTPLQDRSLFKGVRQIPPGHVLVLENNRHRIERYWDFNYPESAGRNFKLSDAEAIETFRGCLDDAVKLRLRADVPVGVYLSGGLDSCSILGTVAKFRGTGVKAFTIGFPDDNYDESAIAREMAELTGADFNMHMATQAALADNFVDSIRHCETIVANSHSVAKFMLSKSVRESGYKVVLTGEGSDEILGGYSHFRQDLLLYTQDHGSPLTLKKSLRQLKNKNRFGLVHTAHPKANPNHTIARRLGFIPSWMSARISAGNGLKYLLAKNIKKNHAASDPYAVFLDDLEVETQLKGRHVLNQSMYLWSKIYLPNYLLCSLGDRMEMAHSVEGRVPFLDHKLVEFATTLPISLKIRNMTEKYILREAARPVISDTIYNRQKHPFSAPPFKQKRNEPMFRFLLEYICDNLRSLPFFNPRRIWLILKFIENVPLPLRFRQEIDAFLMILASMAALQEQFF